MDGKLHTIALVSSAGGLAATVEVLAALPPDLPASVVVLQHISPAHISSLPEILGSKTRLQVVPATDGATLEQGLVQVAPPGLHTLITPDGHLSLVESGDFPPSRPSADLLLTTLALARGERAVAVILSGAGQDGATGATVVHKHRGIVVATDQDTSHRFGMPGAAIDRDHIVDRVVPLDEVAGALREIVG